MVKNHWRTGTGQRLWMRALSHGKKASRRPGPGPVFYLAIALLVATVVPLSGTVQAEENDDNIDVVERPGEDLPVEVNHPARDPAAARS
jgi:hypothetical protein